MDRDPYVVFLEKFKNPEKKEIFLLGTIKNKMPNLKVELGDITLDISDLLIDKFLLDRYNISINCSCKDCNINHNLSDELKIGDNVLMIEKYNKFIILSKVVSLI